MNTAFTVAGSVSLESRVLVHRLLENVLIFFFFLSFSSPVVLL